MKTYRQLEIQQYTDLSKYSGIKVGGEAAYFFELETTAELPTVIEFAKENKLLVVPIGSGTNSFYNAGTLNILAIKNNLKGITVAAESDSEITLQIASGENWNSLVDFAVKNGYSGIEALTAIPGTVGAAPVQNIGAYGQEVSEVISEVEVFDVQQGIVKTMSNKACDFSYRNSKFKENPNTYIILSVTIKLGKESHPGIPNYQAAKEYFDEKGISDPNLTEIRDGIADIRWSKLPHPEVLPNCGSWFKNPIISKNDYKTNDTLQDCIKWAIEDEEVKLSAGWLVDQAVGKDYEDKYFATYGKNALILVNHSLTSNTNKLLNFEKKIVQAVEQKFNIILEREPIMIT